MNAKTESYFLLFAIVVLANQLIEPISAAAQRSSTRTKPAKPRDDLCQLDVDPGTCTDRQRRFYYDPATNKCKQFTYTGCGGNENRFRTISICERRCKESTETPSPAITPAPTRCPPNVCYLECGSAGFDQDESGCDVCRCRDPVTVPPIRASESRCPPTCAMYCPHGFVRDDNGCELCACANPAAPPLLPVQPIADTCDRPQCRKYCPHGYQKDADGCDICGNCAQPPECDDRETCFMFCPAGFRKGPDGCYVCECAGLDDDDDDDEERLGQDAVVDPRRTGVQCRPLRCRKQCEHGFRRDENGCEVCQCNEPEPPAANPLCALRPTCAVHCEHGFQRDADGCNICNCAQPPECEKKREYMCTLFCNAGFKKGYDGCYICECEGDDERRTPVVDRCALRAMCTMFCEHGFEKDSDGCDICRCAQPPRSRRCDNRPACHMRCEHGYQTDGDGCDLCNCAQPPECYSRPLCRMFCPTGFKKGPDGCYVCKCEDTENDRTTPAGVACSPVRCRKHCEHGFKRDEQGCEICQCNEPSVSLLPSRNQQANRCADRRRCRKYCDRGYKKDSDGCDLCECVEDCSPVQCLMFCDHGFEKDAYGCTVCRCNRIPDTASAIQTGIDVAVADSRKSTVCALRPTVGSCHASLSRWYFDSDDKKCKTFTYGGCRGNANNFQSESKCASYCSPEINQQSVEKRNRNRRLFNLE